MSAVTSFQAIANTADRWKELEQLRQMRALVEKHPEWLDQEPQLKHLLTISA